MFGRSDLSKSEIARRWTWNHLTHKHLMQMATGHDVVVVGMAAHSFQNGT